MSDPQQGETQFAPRSVGKYRIVGVLGTGGMGVVYKGYDASIDRFVALKTIRADLLAGTQGAEWRERFKREARAAARCLHPNIVTVFEYGEQDATAFIAMEFVNGRPLQQFLSERVPFDQPVALRLIEQVLDALDYAHCKGVVHRDIKPSNIMLVDGGRIKVADFGIARIETVGISTTQHAPVIGTPSYMAPERFTGGVVDLRSDLFAVGVVLFELLTGEKPFPGRTTTEVMYNVLHHPPRDATTLNPTVPPSVNLVVRRSLARDPGARFQSAADFAAALKAAASSAAPRPVPDTPEPDYTVVTPPWNLPPVATGAPPVATGGARPAPPATGSLTGTGALGRGDSALGELLRRAEEDLTFYVGPVAKIMVRKAAGDATTLTELYTTLAVHIPSEADREAFLRRGRQAAASTLTGLTLDSSLRRTTGTLGPGLTGAAGLPEQDLDRVQRDLTEVLGPIARILVRKAARQASTLTDLYRLLSEHIPNEPARTAFMKKAPR